MATDKPGKNRSPLILALAGAGLVILAAWVIHLVQGLPFTAMTRDPANYFKAPTATGFMSTLGIFLWALTAGICLFAGLALRRSGRRGTMTGFILYSGLLTLVLGLDDALLWHERVLPALGVPETATYAGYGLVTGAYLLLFRKTLLDGDFPLLAVALGAFAGSMALDVASLSGKFACFAEDCLKFIGIVSWTVHFINAAWRTCLRQMKAGPVVTGTGNGQMT